MKTSPKGMKATGNTTKPTMKKYEDDPKGKKKKNNLFQSSESPSVGQRLAQGPAIAALSGLVTTAGAAILANRKAPKPEKLANLSEKQANLANKKMNRANRIEEKRPTRAAVLRAKAEVLNKKSEANKKASEQYKK
jgi:hypothetical protein